MNPTQQPLSEILRLPPGEVELASYEADATPGFDGDKTDGKVALAELEEPLSDLQAELIALKRASRRVPLR